MCTTKNGSYLSYYNSDNMRVIYILDKDEELFIKELRSLTYQDRKDVYLGLNTLIRAKKK